MKYFTFKSSDAQNVIDESGNREYPFQRLPDKYKKNVRKEVWSLSQNSAGLSIRFKTNSEKVIFKCASRDETWITSPIINNYIELHKGGYAHSVEVWDEDAVKKYYKDNISSKLKSPLFI